MLKAAPKRSSEASSGWRHVPSPWPPVGWSAAECVKSHAVAENHFVARRSEEALVRLAGVEPATLGLEVLVPFEAFYRCLLTVSSSSTVSVGCTRVRPIASRYVPSVTSWVTESNSFRQRGPTGASLENPAHPGRTVSVASARLAGALHPVKRLALLLVDERALGRCAAPAALRRPRYRCRVPVNAPRSWPNSSFASSSAGTAPQFTITNGRHSGGATRPRKLATETLVRQGCVDARDPPKAVVEGWALYEDLATHAHHG